MTISVHAYNSNTTYEATKSASQFNRFCVSYLRYLDFVKSDSLPVFDRTRCFRRFFDEEILELRDREAHATATGERATGEGTLPGTSPGPHTRLSLHQEKRKTTFSTQKQCW